MNDGLLLIGYLIKLVWEIAIIATVVKVWF